jgi:cytochrome c peroxidase
MTTTKSIYSFFFVALVFSVTVSQTWAVCGLPPEPGPNHPIDGDPTLPSLKNLKHFRNPSGVLATFSPNGSLDLSDNNEFFNSVSTNDKDGNGRTCGHCHAPQNAWSISPGSVQATFNKTHGKDPLFRPNDGANSPFAYVATEAERCVAYSMLLKYADIRITLPVPGNSTFMLTNIQDPYGYASVENGLSLFRRPMPATNLNFINSVMWDGREAVIDATAGFVQFVSLGNQASHATEGHAEGPPLSDAQKENIIEFETSLFTAQIKDDSVNRLDIKSAKGGPLNLTDPMVTSTEGRGFNLFDSWKTLPANTQVNRERLAIARGQVVFNTGNLGEFSPGGARRHCASCHTRLNVGNYAAQAPSNPDSESFFDVRASDPDFIGTINSGLATELPKYTLEFTVGSKNPPAGSINIVTGERCTTTPPSARCRIITTDPGRALITGLYSDINKFRAPPLRGLSGRAPYFHNGVAKSLDDVVNFYIKVFGMTVIDSPAPSLNPNELTRQEVNDLVRFMEAL